MQPRLFNLASSDYAPVDVTRKKSSSRDSNICCKRCSSEMRGKQEALRSLRSFLVSRGEYRWWEGGDVLPTTALWPSFIALRVGETLCEHPLD